MCIFATTDSIKSKNLNQKSLMDLKDQLKQIADRVVKLKDQIQTEEATKNAFIMPFLQALGYDVFNPLEVVPEFIADIGIKKGEKLIMQYLKMANPQYW
jgi:predicted type IV restriction endonuclease